MENDREVRPARMVSRWCLLVISGIYMILDFYVFTFFVNHTPDTDDYQDGHQQHQKRVYPQFFSHFACKGTKLFPKTQIYLVFCSLIRTFAPAIHIFNYFGKE
jgi:hypothetical protein